MKLLCILYALAAAAHGATDIYLRPVFEKSANGIFNKNKDVHFGCELNNLIELSKLGQCFR